MTIGGLHHASITIPTGAGNQARAFPCWLLGQPAIASLISLAGRGGFRLMVAAIQVHVGTEDGGEQAAKKAHLVYPITDVAARRVRLAAAGNVPLNGVPIPNHDRFECRDPFANHLEFSGLHTSD